MARVKTWIAEILTFGDLNAEFNNILNNPGSLITPITFNLTFTDATYDIGASGATRPRDFYLSRNAVVGGTLAVTGNTTLASVDIGGGYGSSGVTITAAGNVSMDGSLVLAASQTVDLSGSSGTNFGRFSYTSGGNTSLLIDNAIDSANAEIRLRTRTLGSAVNCLLLTSTAATFIGTVTSTQLLGTSAGALRVTDGARIGADSTNNLLDDSSNGAATQTLFIGNASINVTSDARVKPNRKPTERGAWNLIDQVEVVDHEWDPESIYAPMNKRGRFMGVVAQQIQPITPWAVNVPDEEKDANGKLNLWFVEHVHLVPLLIKDAQETHGRLRALEKLIGA